MNEMNHHIILVNKSFTFYNVSPSFKTYFIVGSGNPVCRRKGNKKFRRRNLNTAARPIFTAFMCREGEKIFSVIYVYTYYVYTYTNFYEGLTLTSASPFIVYSTALQDIPTSYLGVICTWSMDIQPRGVPSSLATSPAYKQT